MQVSYTRTTGVVRAISVAVTYSDGGIQHGVVGYEGFDVKRYTSYVSSSNGQWERSGVVPVSVEFVELPR